VRREPEASYRSLTTNEDCTDKGELDTLLSLPLLRLPP
jgi:hypothetical protein